MRAVLTSVAALSLLVTPVCAQESPQAAQPVPHWPSGTEVRMMVIREINSRTAKVGDRFALRVNEPVRIGGQIAIPVGAKAWAEIVTASKTGAAGGRGNLSLRLLYVETAWGNVALSGFQGSQGAHNTSGVVIAVLGFGPLGLLTKGGNAAFKAGDIVQGHIGEEGAPATEATGAGKPEGS